MFLSSKADCKLSRISELALIKSLNIICFLSGDVNGSRKSSKFSCHVFCSVSNDDENPVVVERFADAIILGSFNRNDDVDGAFDFDKVVQKRKGQLAW